MLPCTGHRTAALWQVGMCRRRGPSPSTRCVFLAANFVQPLQRRQPRPPGAEHFQHAFTRLDLRRVPQDQRCIGCGPIYLCVVSSCTLRLYAVLVQHLLSMEKREEAGYFKLWGHMSASNPISSTCQTTQNDETHSVCKPNPFL